MTDGDPREELAGIARKVRARIVREEALGLGELLVRDATRRGRPAATGGTAPATRARSPRTTPPPAPAPMAPMTPPVAPEVAAAPVAKADITTPAAPPASFGAEVSGIVTPPTPVVAATAAEVDLFGNPVTRIAPIAEEAEAAALAPPSIHRDLHPIDAAARAAIHAESLPVLEQIAGEVRACRKCGLCETRTQAVPGVGSARTGIAFVGEAPGADEDAKGEPFVGRAGQLLTRIIQVMDEQKLIPGLELSRATVFIGNVLKCRPPENRNPLPHEIEMCAPYLERQLEALKPRIICCLGKFAAELLVGVKGTIGGLRGRVYSYRGAKLIVTYHPAACLRNPGYKRPVWEDMQLLAREYLSD